MKGLSFQVQQAVATGSPNRMDIACFIGCVELREDAPRDDINDWLYRQSWLNSDDGFAATYHRESARELLDVPVPIESWERFDQLYDWQQRRFGDQVTGAGYLATAVRSFFAQGGRFCYVIRVAGNLDYTADAVTRQALLPLLIPGYPAAVNSQPTDRSSWHGIGHLLGLPDVTMVCLPDLPELFSTESQLVDIAPPTPPAAAEQFVICQPGDRDDTDDSALRQLPAPVCNDADYARWGAAINRVANFIAVRRRETQLIAALPLPAASCVAARNPLAFMHQQGWLSGSLASSPTCLASAFVQLVYPWLITGGSSLLAQGIEPPDGTLSGLLARNALLRGAFRNLSGLSQRDVQGLYPELSRQQRFAPYDKAGSHDSPDAALIDRVTLFGYTAQDITLLSDVTTSNGSVHRPAAIDRIIVMILRVARQTGEEFVFENNGQALWSEISQRLNDVLRRLFELGALRGKNPEQAFYVRCDQSTMTRQDLDDGRVVAQISFDPAASIESIEVLLTMQHNGSVALSSIGIDEQAVA